MRVRARVAAQTKVLTDVSTKKLMPYHPNAPRNRPPETLRNVPGKRFGLNVTRDSKETYRGSSQACVPLSRTAFKPNLVSV